MTISYTFYAMVVVYNSITSQLVFIISDRRHVVDMLPNVWMLDGRLITGE